MQANKTNDIKYKQINSSRRKIAKRQPSSKPLQRLKSHHQQQMQNLNSQEVKIVKPQSSLHKRASSAKHTDTTNSITTNASGKSQNQIKTLIAESLCHNLKVKQFLKERHLSESQARDKLLDNQLFALSLIANVVGKTPEEAHSSIEEAIIRKITRMETYQKQIKSCKNVQNRISKLIEQRIKALKNINKQ